MKDDGATLTEILLKADNRSRDERVPRLRFLIKEYGAERWIRLPGDVADRMFEEARDAYLDGLYCACLLLCSAVITQQLASVFREGGDDVLAESDAEDLYLAARDQGIISATDFSIYNGIRKLRNSYVHPPRFGSRLHLARRAIGARTDVRGVTAQDARRALKALFLMLNRPRFSIRS